MGVSLDELRRKAKKYDPQEEEENQRLVESYLEGYHGQRGVVVGSFVRRPSVPSEPTEPQEGEFEEVDQTEQDLIESVDHLDNAYTLLTDILNHGSTRLNKELRYRASELVDALGDYLESMTGLTSHNFDVH